MYEAKLEALRTVLDEVHQFMAEIRKNDCTIEFKTGQWAALTKVNRFVMEMMTEANNEELIRIAEEHAASQHG